MSIAVACAACGAKLKAPEDTAGRIRKCPQCGAKVAVPGHSSRERRPAVQSASPPPPQAVGVPAAIPIAIPLPPTPVDAWYLARNKTKYGPYSSEQLKQLAATGQLRPEDMLLQEGKGKWQAANSLDWIASLLAPKPSPPQAVVVPAAIPVELPVLDVPVLDVPVLAVMADPSGFAELSKPKRSHANCVRSQGQACWYCRQSVPADLIQCPYCRLLTARKRNH